MESEKMNELHVNLEAKISKIFGIDMDSIDPKHYFAVNIEDAMALGNHAVRLGFATAYGDALVDVMIEDYHDDYRETGIWFAVANAPALARAKAFVRAAEKAKR